MKWFKKITLPVTVAMATVMIFDAASYATYYNRDAFFSGNGLPDASLADLVYAVDPSVVSMGYDGYSLDARTEYDKVANASINFRKASTATEINSAKLRYVAEDVPEVTWFGRVYAFDANGYEYGDCQPSCVTAQEAGAWSQVHLKYNNWKMNNSGLSANSRRRVATHELGHVMSLKHQPTNPSDWPSVMQETFVNNESWVLTSTDIGNLQYMY